MLSVLRRIRWRSGHVPCPEGVLTMSNLLKGNKSALWFAAMWFSLIYFVALAFLYLQTDALVPDESWFFGIMNDIWNRFLSGQAMAIENYLGYGQIYWFIGAILHHLSLIRMVSLACMVVLLCLVAETVKRSGASQTIRALSVLLYLSMPIAWFTGKIIGPEILGTSLGAAACFVYMAGEKPNSTKYYVISMVLLGFSCGIKLNNVIFAFYLACHILLNWSQSKGKEIYKQLLLGLLSFGAGMFASNPIMLYDFPKWQANMGTDSVWSSKYLPSVLWGKGIAWDLVNVGGINTFILSVWVLLAIILLALTFDHTRGLILLLTVMFSVAVCCKSGFLGWYLMPLLYIIPSCAGTALRNGKAARNLLFMCVLGNMLLMYQYTHYQVDSKIDQLKILKNAEFYEQSIDQFFDETGYERSSVLCRTEFGLPVYGASSASPASMNPGEILIVFPRFLNSPEISYIINQAKQNSGEFSLVRETPDMYFLVKN